MAFTKVEIIGAEHYTVEGADRILTNAEITQLNKMQDAIVEIMKNLSLQAGTEELGK